ARSKARVCWRSWATASPPITSRRQDQSSQSRPLGNIWSRTASKSKISTPTALGVAIMKSWCAARSRTSACAIAWCRISNADSHGLTGEEVYDVLGVRDLLAGASGQTLAKVRATRNGGGCVEFDAVVRIDTPQEALYYQHGGILQYVLRQLLAGKAKPEVVRKGVSTVADPTTGSIVT